MDEVRKNLSDSDKALYREMARQIVREVLLEHIAACPYGKSLLIARWFIVGALLGSGVLSGSVVVTLMKLFGS